MISIIHYISSTRRLEEMNKTIGMMGGKEECPPLLLAQRDMIKFEKEYYHDKMVNFFYLLAIVTVIVLPLSFLLFKGVL